MSNITLAHNTTLRPGKAHKYHVELLTLGERQQSTTIDNKDRANVKGIVIISSGCDTTKLSSLSLKPARLLAAAAAAALTKTKTKKKEKTYLARSKERLVRPEEIQQL